MTNPGDPVLFGGDPTPPTVEVGRNEQWRLERLILCNWGGFGGIHIIDIHRDSALLSGASGAGKSTILDAYTALLNPARPFNVASNDAGERRRSEGTRTTLTYVRGQYDRAERDGVLVPRVLRGDGQDTWSAIAAVFAASGGIRQSLLRLFFAPQEAHAWPDMNQTYGIFDGRIDKHHIELLEPLATSSFRKDHVEKALPGLRVLSQTQYVEQVRTKLHIGASADGAAKAMKLLHELQSGKPQPSVDALFKQMVLEEPITFKEADKAIDSFDKLDEGYREIKSKEEQHEVLQNIDEDHDKFVDAQADIDRIDTLRVTGSEASPFVLWASRRKAEAYEDNILEAEAELEAARSEQADWTQKKQDFEAKQADADERYRIGGGGSREAAEQEIERLGQQRGRIERARGLFENKILSFVASPTSAHEFAAAQAQACKFLGGYDRELAGLTSQERELSGVYYPLKNKREELQAELQHLKTHKGNIPSGRHQMRVAFAEAAGLQVSDLPFVGELIDMHADHEEWRTAADAVLGGFAFTLLVDQSKLRHLRRSVNGIRTPVRIPFEGVPFGVRVPEAASAATLAGRLIVADGPFAGWLRGHLNRAYDYDCVESADQLVDDGGSRVTREGQTQRGQRGAHGGNMQRRIGFSNEGRQREVQAEIDAMTEKIDDLDKKLDGLGSAKTRLGQQKAAWETVRDTVWTDIDVNAVDAAIAGQEKILARLKAGSPELDELDRLRKQYKQDAEQAGKEANRAEFAGDEFEKQAIQLREEVAALQPVISALESDDSIRLTDEQTEALNTRAGQVADWDGTASTFDAVIRAIRKDIENDLSGAKKDLTAAADRMTSAFGRFQDRWFDPNRGIGLASYEDYLAILTDLRGHGLAQQRQNWSRKVIEYSGDRLSVLNNSYGRAKDDITERLRPISHILRQIPFGNRPDTNLDITANHRHPQGVKEFQQKLRDLAGEAMIPSLDDEAAEAKFEAIRSVLSEVRSNAQSRSELLDVRRHLKVTAQVLERELPVSAYDHIGDKSGGEAQMITAFICGAALRYQLGDEDRDRPRFAPVVLDEAFIKADGRYTKQSVEAWQLLGFQLVIGAPEDKFNAIEPAVGLVIGVTKDLAEHSYVVPAPRKRV